MNFITACTNTMRLVGIYPIFMRQGHKKSGKIVQNIYPSSKSTYRNKLQKAYAEAISNQSKNARFRIDMIKMQMPTFPSNSHFFLFPRPFRSPCVGKKETIAFPQKQRTTTAKSRMEFPFGFCHRKTYGLLSPPKRTFW